MARHRVRRTAGAWSWPVATAALLLAVTPGTTADQPPPSPTAATPTGAAAPAAPAAPPSCPDNNRPGWRFCLPPRAEQRGVVTSLNGWSIDGFAVVDRAVPGTAVTLPVREGAAGDLLVAAAARWNTTIEPIDGPVPDDWGAYRRPVRGESRVWSDHASATAVDLGALAHPLDTAPAATFTACQLAAVRELLAAAGGVLEWGGDYRPRPDPMHLALAPDTTEAQAAAAARALEQSRPTTICTGGPR